MKGQQRRSVKVCGVLLSCLLAISIASQNEPPQVTAVKTASDIISDYSGIQRNLLPILPPNSEHTLAQGGGMLLVENWSGFSKSFVASLMPVEQNGVVKYPVWVMEDATANPRRRLILNVAETVIAEAPVPADYDPGWWVKEAYEGVSVAEFLRLLTIFDGARVAVRYELIDRKNYNKLISTSSEKNGTGTIQPMLLLLGGNGPFDEIQFTAIDPTNNNAMAVTIGCPTNVTAIDVFAVDGGNGLIDSWWTLLGSTNMSTNMVTWVDTATNATDGMRFYAVGNALTNSVTDPDGDDVPWAREVFLYHSSPTNSDTDADGLDDYEEAVNLHTDPSNSDTNKPTGAIDVPPTGFRWVFLP